MIQKLFILTLAALALAATPAAAGGKSKAAQEAAEFVLRKFGRKAAKDGASALARRIERDAITHGDDVIKAVRKVGPRSLHMIEEAGSHSKQMARLLAVHGEEGAVLRRHPAQSPATRPPARRRSRRRTGQIPRRRPAGHRVPRQACRARLQGHRLAEKCPAPGHDGIRRRRVGQDRPHAGDSGRHREVRRQGDGIHLRAQGGAGRHRHAGRVPGGAGAIHQRCEGDYPERGETHRGGARDRRQGRLC